MRGWLTLGVGRPELALAFFRQRQKSEPRFARDGRIGCTALAFGDGLGVDAELRGDALLRAAQLALRLVFGGAHFCLRHVW